MFPAVFNVNSLNGNNGFSVNVESISISGIGDINGDGIDDIGIGTNGGAYAIFGSSSNWPQEFDITTLNGKNGFNIYNLRGTSINYACDINKDGIDDLVVTDQNQNSAFIIFGSKSGFPANINVLTLNGQNGFVIQGSTSTIGTINGLSSACVGDINANGINDLIISAASGAYIIYGSSLGFSSVFNVANLNGVNGFAYYSNSGYYAGCCNSVTAAGDFNNDGIADILVGNIFDSGIESEQQCCATVIFGASAMPPVLNSQSFNSQNSFIGCIVDMGTITLAMGVSGNKDINGDGIGDIILGCGSYEPQRSEDYGQAQVYFGASNNSYGGFTIYTSNTFDLLGSSVTTTDDINGDDLPDLIIGAPGGCYEGAIYGHSVTDPFPSQFPIKGLNGVNGFIIEESGNEDCSLGNLVASLGDINNDGINDIITASDTDTYVVFGESSNSPSRSHNPSPSPGSSHNDGSSNSFSSGELIGGIIGAFTGGVALIGLVWYGKTHGWWCAGEHSHGDGYVGVDGGTN